MLRVLVLSLSILTTFSNRYPGGLIVESPARLAIANPIVRLSAYTTLPGSAIRKVDLQETANLYTPTRSTNVFSGNTNRIDLNIDTSIFDGQEVVLLLQITDGAETHLAHIPVYAISSPRISPWIAAPDTILDFNQAAVLYRTPSGGEISFFNGHRPKQIVYENFNTHRGHLTPNGAILVDRDQSLAVELRHDSILTHTNTMDVNVQGDFGLLLAGWDHQSTLRNFEADTNALISTPFFSAALTSEGTVYLTGWQSSQDTNTVFYQFQGGTLTQLAPETDFVQGRVETDGTNVLWFSGRYELDSNNFQIYLLTPAGRIHLTTNYSPLFRDWIYEPNGLAMQNGGWTVFPRLDSNGVHQVFWRTPDGNIVQATAFRSNTIAAFDLRSDGSFLAIVIERSTFQNHLFFIRPGSPPLDLGPLTHASYRFVGDEIIAYTENVAFSIDVTTAHPMRLTHPHFPSAGNFAVYVTASTNTPFFFEHSTDLQNWSAVSTNLTATVNPTKFQIAAPPGFIRTRQ